MPAIQIPTFNWLPLKSQWKQLDDWRQSQANAQINSEINTALINKLATASADQISGAANLAAKAALTRIQKATKAKQDAQAAKAAAEAQVPKPKEQPTQITLSDGQVINIDPATTLAGGTKVDTKAGTLTLSDGTKIDINTGQPVGQLRLSDGTLIDTTTGLKINKTV
jgi:FKBP-type peptidyl-prolyl cis-trans isomerase